MRANPRYRVQHLFDDGSPAWAGRLFVSKEQNTIEHNTTYGPLDPRNPDHLKYEDLDSDIEQLEGAQRALKIKLDDAVLAQLDEIFPGYKPAPEHYAW